MNPTDPTTPSPPSAYDGLMRPVPFMVAERCATIFTVAFTSRRHPAFRQVIRSLDDLKALQVEAQGIALVWTERPVELIIDFKKNFIEVYDDYRE
jgi:hypothetical protein